MNIIMENAEHLKHQMKMIRNESVCVQELLVFLYKNRMATPCHQLSNDGLQKVRHSLDVIIICSMCFAEQKQKIENDEKSKRIGYLLFIIFL